DPALFAQYDWDGRTIKEHRVLIRERLGFRRGTRQDQQDLRVWLLQQVLPYEHRMAYLQKRAYQRLRELHIQPPPPDKMERVVSSAFDAYEKRFFQETYQK